MAKNFFSKEHIYPTLWTLIVTLLIFVCGYVWTTIYGPEEVIVVNQEHLQDTSITIIKFQPDEKYFNQLNNLTKREAKGAYPKSKNGSKKNEIDSLATKIAEEYQLKFDSLKLAFNAESNEGIHSVQNKLNQSDLISSNESSLKINRPKFKLPQNVSGYTEKKINAYGRITISSNKVNKNDDISISISLNQSVDLNKISPLFVSLVKPKSSHNVYNIWNDQYDLKMRNGSIFISSNFQKGNYILTVGFYLKDEINEKYPPFYSRKFNVEII